MRRAHARSPRGQAGFTLAETLMALSLLTIAIVGVGAALALQAGGSAHGAAVGLSAITRANYISTATMLAQEGIEQTRNATYTCCTPAPIDLLTSALFPDQGYTTITGYGNYRRTVTIQEATPGANMKTITVQVFFRPPTDAGMAASEESVQLVTIIARRKT